MIRKFAIAAASTLAFAAAAVTAQAAPASQSAWGSAATSTPVIAASNHGVCYKHQCPGRSRIVCGCPQGAR
jgi:hypothetical protein